MDLDQIANIVEIPGVLALHRNDTRNAALIALASSFENQDFTDDFLLMICLEKDCRFAGRYK